MILSAQSIRAYGSDLIYPFIGERRVDPDTNLSYGLSACGYDIRVAERTLLKSRTFALASTLERFNIPGNLVMFIKDKSTWARRGMFVQNTVAEPGWRGHLTLELSNDSEIDLDIQIGTPIAQVLFEYLDAYTDLPYIGKYQDQSAGPQRAR